MTETTDEVLRELQSAQRPYASATRLPNPVTTRMSHRVINLRNNKSQIHFESDTLLCNNILLHSAKYYLLDFTIPFLSITPLRLWGSVGYKHCCGMFISNINTNQLRSI